MENKAKNENLSTGDLLDVLKSAHAEDTAAYLNKYENSLAKGDRPFADYMRQMLREKGKTQQQIFIAADIPERYGYKLISGEKRTKQRDYILRLCCAAGFNLDETQRALKLYPMPELYARTPRDAVLIIGFNTGVKTVQQLSALLLKHDMPQLYSCNYNEID